MSYRPKDERIIIGDTWHCSIGDVIHAFFLQFQKGGKESCGVEAGAIGHAVSKDMLSWKTLPLVLPCGEKGGYDDLEHFTGCTVYQDGKMYLFYTSRSSVDEPYSNSVAVSSDGVHFEKCPDNPLFTPDERYYYGVNNRSALAFHGNNNGNEYELRDLALHWDEENALWRGYYVARLYGNDCTQTAAIAMVTSRDFLRWDQYPPCFVPRRYHIIETPEVFAINGKWYLLFLSGNIYGQRHCTKDPIPYNRITSYAVSDSMEGPFYEPEDNLLIANMNDSAACAKTVLHGGKRYLFYTEVHSNDGFPEEQYNYMSVPKEVTADEKGRLELKWYSEIERYYTEEKFPFSSSTAIQNNGRWGSVGIWNVSDGKISGSCKSDWSVQPFALKAGDFVLETTVCNQNAVSAGVVFGLGDTIFDGGISVILDYCHNEILITTARNYQIYDARSFRLDQNEYRLKVFVHNKTVEIYINDTFWLHHLMNHRPGKVALMVEAGEVQFRDTVMHSVGKFDALE